MENNQYFCEFLCVRTHINKISQVSFGSLFWLSVPEYVDEQIEALIAKKAPFVRFFYSLLFFAHTNNSMIQVFANTEYQILTNPPQIATLC